MLDGRTRNAYVGRVNLLLLLSALLSALTGAQGVTRAAPVPMAVSQHAERAVVERVAHVVAPGRPMVALPRPAGLSVLPAGWVLAPAQPIYLSRRRE
ncbi:hypothetical protein [Sphingomonas sp.]|uniref:hypothetical protein n=1 Tax=Sphingomonas sp. TaxID=28214 RepID=UPI003B002B3E